MATAIQILPSVRSMVNEDGAVLLDIAQGVMVNLNPVGGFIWNLMRDGASEPAIVAKIVGEFGIDEHQAATDLEEFLADLYKRTLISRPSLP